MKHWLGARWRNKMYALSLLQAGSPRLFSVAVNHVQSRSIRSPIEQLMHSLLILLSMTVADKPYAECLLQAIRKQGKERESQSNVHYHVSVAVKMGESVTSRGINNLRPLHGVPARAVHISLLIYCGESFCFH